MNLPYIKLFADISATVDLLSDTEAGRLFKSLLHYANDKEDNLVGQEKLVFAMLKTQIDRDAATYQSFIDKQRLNGQKGGRPKKPMVSDDNPENPSLFLKTQKSQEEEKEEDKEKDKDNSSITTPFGNVVINTAQNYAQQYLVGLTSTHLEEVDQYSEIMGEELVKHAIDESIANGVRSWAYVRAILRGYMKDNIKTIAQAEQAKESHKKAVSTQGKQVAAQQYTQRDYTEDELEARATDLLQEAASL